MTKTEDKRFPGALWLLPIFFGLFGGIVAALIANLKYGAHWMELFLVGLLLQVAGFMFWFLVGLAGY